MNNEKLIQQAKAVYMDAMNNERDPLKEVIELLEKQHSSVSVNEQMLEALKRHHKWQCENPMTDKEHGFSYAAEYCDSSLFSDTVQAITNAASAKVDPRDEIIAKLKEGLVEAYQLLGSISTQFAFPAIPNLIERLDKILKTLAAEQIIKERK